MTQLTKQYEDGWDGSNNQNDEDVWGDVGTVCGDVGTVCGDVGTVC